MHFAGCWVLGVGLVFVVVVGMALQVARRRADERWLSVMAHWDKEWGRADAWDSRTVASGGHILRKWRQAQWEWCALVLRQEQYFFGSSIEARMHMPGAHFPPEVVATIRDILAEIDIDLIVEP